MRTPSQTVGPFYSIGMLDSAPAADGVRVSGTLFDGVGEPIPDGVIEVWSATARAWGRCGTHPDGRFEFVLPRAPHYEVYVFARGLLRHQLTRLYFEPPDDPVLATLVAQPDGDGLRFDIRMQGERQTVFFAT